jgi:chemotaxis protein histidine kinase CheA
MPNEKASKTADKIPMSGLKYKTWEVVGESRGHRVDLSAGMNENEWVEDSLIVEEEDNRSDISEPMSEVYLLIADWEQEAEEALARDAELDAFERDTEEFRKNVLPYCSPLRRPVPPRVPTKEELEEKERKRVAEVRAQLKKDAERIHELARLSEIAEELERYQRDQETLRRIQFAANARKAQQAAREAAQAREEAKENARIKGNRNKEMAKELREKQLAIAAEQKSLLEAERAKTAAAARAKVEAARAKAAAEAQVKVVRLVPEPEPEKEETENEIENEIDEEEKKEEEQLMCIMRKTVGKEFPIVPVEPKPVAPKPVTSTVEQEPEPGWTIVTRKKAQPKPKPEPVQVATTMKLAEFHETVCPPPPVELPEIKVATGNERKPYTRFCKALREGRQCNKARCIFAHTIEELREDLCPYGNKCPCVYYNGAVWFNRPECESPSERCNRIHPKETKLCYATRVGVTKFAAKSRPNVVELVAKAPPVVAKQSSETKLAPAVAKPAPVVANPAPVVAKPAPVVANPAPVVAKPAPVVANPAPVVAKPAPVVANPAPVVANPAPVVANPAPVVAKPAPVVANPAPVVAKPAPVVANPAPVVAKPAPAAETKVAIFKLAPWAKAPIVPDRVISEMAPLCIITPVGSHTWRVIIPRNLTECAKAKVRATLLALMFRVARQGQFLCIQMQTEK